MSHRARAILLFVVVACFSVLIFGGAKISEHKPPIPERVVAPSGELVFTGDDIRLGQRQYLSRGGQQTGSIWGHGAYLAPDWSADTLHRTGLVAAGLARGLAPADAARFAQADLEALPAGERGRVEAEVKAELRRNRYDAATGTLTLSPGAGGGAPGARRVLHRPVRARLRRDVDPRGLRRATPPTPARSPPSSGGPPGRPARTGPARSSATPPTSPTIPLVGNVPLPSALVWSIVSMVLLILGTAVAIFAYLRLRAKDPEHRAELAPLAQPAPTPSQRAVLPFFAVAILLFIVQAALGSLTGHYAVEGNKLFGLDTGAILPYAATPRLAPAARGLLDRHLLARHRPLHRAARHRRPRAEGAARARPRAPRRARGGGRRRARRHLARRAGAALRPERLARRAPGLRVHRARPRLAARPHRRDAALARPRLPGREAGPRRGEGQGRPHPPPPLRLGLDPALLRGRPRSTRRARTSPSPTTGAGGWCTSGSRTSSRSSPRSRSPSSSRRSARWASGARSGRRTSPSCSTSAPASSAPSTTSTSRARRSSSPPSARPSRRSRSSRSRSSASRSTRT